MCTQNVCSEKNIAKSRECRGGSRNFESGVHTILGSRFAIFRLWPHFESVVVASLWKVVLHSGVQHCIRLYRDSHSMNQYLIFWLKIKCLKCYTMYYILLNYHPACRSHEQCFFTENIKWHVFLIFCCCGNANMYSRMADKLFKGNNSGTLKNVSIDIGVIGMQGKTTVEPELKVTPLCTWCAPQVH